MRHALSTHLFVQHRLTTALLDRIADAGLPAVEIFCARQHFDYRNAAQLAELAHWCKDSPLAVHSIHSPIYNDEVWGRSGPQSVVNICETRKAQRIAHVDEIKRVLEFAEEVPFRYLIQHLGAPREEYDERKIDAAFSSLDELRIFAKARGVEILLENIPNAFSSAQRLVEFFQVTHLDLGVCLDLGHANLAEGVPAAFQTLAERIRSTHVHDNDGREDSHLFPLLAEGGTIAWPEAMRLLRSREAQYPLLLELKEVPDMPDPLSQARAVFDRLEAL